MRETDMTDGKVALVTGGSSGIGEATARELHRRGFTVYAAARRLERMEDLATAGIRTLRMDVTDDDSVTSGIRTVLAEAGRIDVLVNNAGYGSYGALEVVPRRVAVQFFIKRFLSDRTVDRIAAGRSAGSQSGK
ncbi:SDR family NAD(P)-dependent oxidoreductase [Kitasatospora kifunensis]|uniref:NADP-dependent 3-hydroxy acid dehydrogenase YdfG n=1 Tax=Kitasatospora kifunensis TaxID=58351 RepID=A0A7W7VZS4_KITKI|nr:SDR family NAD(P)-dependent oxidoreductase [Kitasatospora kifunensis]MBB4928408.1 NADP-dependent 3-hydroxy acid dehydrogenase YdfG [Kitasatospora kifunensis]